MNAGVGLFPEAHQPLVRRLLSQSAGAISGYITGNLAISVICGVTTFIVLLVLGMPYAAPLALLVAVLDLVPLVGATLGGAPKNPGLARSEVCATSSAAARRDGAGGGTDRAPQRALARGQCGSALRSVLPSGRGYGSGRAGEEQPRCRPAWVLCRPAKRRRQARPHKTIHVAETQVGPRA